MLLGADIDEHENKCSGIKVIILGVPQCIVLGSIRYHLYTCFPLENVTLATFADDSGILPKKKNIEEP